MLRRLKEEVEVRLPPKVSMRGGRGAEGALSDMYQRAHSAGTRSLRNCNALPCVLCVVCVVLRSLVAVWDPRCTRVLGGPSCVPFLEVSPFP